METPSRCPLCGSVTHFPEGCDVDPETVDWLALKEHRDQRRDWIFLSEAEEMLFETTSGPFDGSIQGIVDVLDEERRRDHLRKLLGVLGWEHIPLRTLVDENGNSRELWGRTQTMMEMDRHISTYMVRDHPFWAVVGDYLGLARRRSTGPWSPLYDTSFRQAQADRIAAHLEEMKRPLWRSEIAEALGIAVNDVTIALTLLRIKNRVVVFRYSKKGNDATYAHPEYAHLFEDVPVEELLPVDEESIHDLYEEVSRVIKGHTSVEEAKIMAAFPSVRRGVIRSVLDQFGWRPRKVARKHCWVAPGHPHFRSRFPDTRQRERAVQERREEYETEPEEMAEAVAPELPEPEPEEVVELTDVETRVLETMQGCGLLGIREIAKQTDVPTRRAKTAIESLVEAGKVMEISMGASPGYLAR